MTMHLVQSNCFSTSDFCQNCFQKTFRWQVCYKAEKSIECVFPLFEQSLIFCASATMSWDYFFRHFSINLLDLRFFPQEFVSEFASLFIFWRSLHFADTSSVISTLLWLFLIASIYNPIEPLVIRTDSRSFVEILLISRWTFFPLSFWPRHPWLGTF